MKTNALRKFSDISIRALTVDIIPCSLKITKNYSNRTLLTTKFAPETTKQYIIKIYYLIMFYLEV